MNKTAIVTLALMGAVLVLALCATFYFANKPSDAVDSKARKTLSTESGFVFTDLNGEEITFDQYEGKVRVVNMWASWTPFSATELPVLHTLAGEFKERDVVVIAVNRKESKELAVGFLNSLQVFEHIVFALDPQDALYASVEGYAMPETIIYDADGNVSHHNRGPMTELQLRTHIEKALEASQ